MKRALIATLLLACEDPAALEVRVSIEESPLDDLQVVVRRGDEEGPAVFDCTLALDRDPVGLCPLDGGEGRWTDPAQLSFVMYGRPATELAINVDGRRELEMRSEVVTTTAASVALPPNSGERALLELPLVDRTNPRVRCSSDEISPTLVPEQGSLVVFPSDSSAYVALGLEESGNDGAIFRASHRRDGDTCTITTELAAELGCRLRPRSMVGAVINAGSILLAGICASGFGPAQTTALRAVVLSDRSFRKYEMQVDVANARVTQPVLTRFLLPASDAAGAVQVSAVVARRQNEVGLFVWAPTTGTSTTFSLPGVGVSLQANETLSGPIVASGPVRDALVIAGYGGTNGIAWAPGRTNDVTFTPFGEDNLEASRRAPALALAPMPMLVDVRANEVQFTPLVLGEMPPRAGPSFASTIIGSANRDLGVRVAIARLGSEAELHAVFTDYGIVQMHPLDGGAPSQFDGWNGRGVGAQHTLLWNMDGSTGAEIISYDSAYDSIWASTSSGRLFDEWAPWETAKTASSLAVVLARLEGTRDSDLDVVALAGNYLEVTTLGSNSAPSLRDQPWPMPSFDPAATAVFEEARVDRTPPSTR